MNGWGGIGSALLLWPGLFGGAALAWLLVWIQRKLAARLQGRIGPPFYQPFFDFVKLAFTQRRKTLTNNLKSIPNIEDHLVALKHRLDIRAEAIDPSQWWELYARIYEN